LQRLQQLTVQLVERVGLHPELLISKPGPAAARSLRLLPAIVRPRLRGALPWTRATSPAVRNLCDGLTIPAVFAQRE
jgi:hypothetical protein